MNGTSKISGNEIALALAPFHVQLAAPQLDQIGRLVSSLLLWNKKLSLTSLSDPKEIVARHFGESIFGGQAINISVNNGRLADVGTGGGFPGLPLKIAFPELEVTLIEVNAKKCAFLREAIQQLDLKGISVFRGPYAEVPQPSLGFDVICSRALGDYRNLLHWSVGALAPSGRVAMWLGQDEANRLSRLDNWTWELPIAIPESQKRVVMAGSPKRS